MRAAVRNAARAVRPVARLSRALQDGPRLSLIGWHRIGSSGDPLSTPLDVFRRQLDVLEQWGAHVLPLDDAVRLCATGALPDRALALTFDDGYASAVEAAWPLLRERRMPATLFVVTNYVDGVKRFPWDAKEEPDDLTRLATVEQIAAAAAQGLDIGSHTVTHRWLPHLDVRDLERELRDSRAVTEDLVGRPVRALAYPMGGWNSGVVEAARRAGYAIGVTTDRGNNSKRQDPLALRRAIAPDTVADFRLVLDGALTWLRPLDRWRSRRGPRW